MKSTSRKMILVLALLLLPGCGSGDEARVSPPDPDLSAMEPEVVTLLSETRQRVVEEPGSAEAWGGLGAVYQAHRLSREAATCYTQARRLAPDDFRWAYFLAIVIELEGAGVDEIVERFAEAEKLRADYAPLYIRLGLALSRRGVYDRARDALLRSVELDPESAMAHRGLGQVLLALDEPEAAVERLETAARLAPHDGSAQSALAQAYMRLGEQERAEQAAERASRMNPVSGVEDPVLRESVLSLAASAQRGFGQVQRLIAEGDFDAAAEKLDTLERQRPDDPDVQYLKALVAARQGQRAEAEAALASALELDDTHVRSHIELGRSLETRGELDEALSHYRRAQELAPRDPTVLVDLARVLEKRDDTDGLIEIYESLAAMRPEDARIQLNLGTMWGRKRDLVRAEEHFRAAVRLDPSSPDAHFRLGVALEGQDRLDEAVEHYETAAGLDPSHAAMRRLAEMSSPSP